MSTPKMPKIAKGPMPSAKPKDVMLVDGAAVKGSFKDRTRSLKFEKKDACEMGTEMSRARAIKPAGRKMMRKHAK
ncbi:hypothetical protein AYO40_01115 [Planctomycetaceae bacterium SCGC AG-212-D15]|nr:hypothetical protein AYO40_01115 [Planctomycetaceae bacterium SCGC AG-212-D15]